MVIQSNLKEGSVSIHYKSIAIMKSGEVNFFDVGIPHSMHTMRHSIRQVMFGG